MTALRKTEKLTKQRISNKQNFTHLSETCDWNNYFFSLMNIFSCEMTQVHGLHGPFSGLWAGLAVVGQKSFVAFSGSLISLFQTISGCKTRKTKLPYSLIVNKLTF